MRIGNAELKERINNENPAGFVLQSPFVCPYGLSSKSKKQQASISHQRMLVFTFLLFRQKQQQASSSYQRMLVFAFLLFRQKLTASMPH